MNVAGEILMQISILYFEFWGKSFESLQSFKYCLIFIESYCTLLFKVKGVIHIATFEKKNFVTSAILAKVSILDIGTGPRYTSDSYHFILRKPSGKKIIKANNIHF